MQKQVLSKMKFAYKTPILVVAVTSLLACFNAVSAFNRDSEIGLLNYMARSNDLLKQDPARSLNCFNKYLPLINTIANNYETNYKACLNESEAASDKADLATLEQRNGLANAAKASCALLEQCQEDKSAVGEFQCYIGGGSANTQTMYVINANASQDLAALREEYYLIQNEEYKCTNKTKRIYEIESAEAYAALNNCILGGSDIVTEKPTTSAKTTTAEPEATTDQPTEPTKEPETTNRPLTTTKTPETTETKSEENTSAKSEELDTFNDYFY